MDSDFNLALEAWNVNDRPDIEEGMNQAHALMLGLTSLETMVEEISSNQQISREQAAFLSDVCGVDFGVNYPLGSFTLESSQNNLNVAIEASIHDVFDTIKKFIVKVVSLIIDILKWIFTLLTSYPFRQKNVEAVVKNLDVVQKVNKEVAERTGVNPKATLSDAPILKTPSPEEIRFRDACVSYDANWNGFRYEVVSNGKYPHFLRSFSVYIDTVLSIMAERVDHFAKLLKVEERPDDMGYNLSLQAQFASLAQPMPVAALAHAVRSAGFKEGSDLSATTPTYEQVVDALTKAGSALVQDKNGMKVDPFTAADILIAGKVAEPYMVKSATDAKLVNHLIEDFKKVLAVRPAHTFSDALSGQYRRMVQTLTGEVKAFQALVVLYTNMDREVAGLVKDTAHAAFCLYELNDAKIKTMEEGHEKEQLKSLQHSIHAALQRLS